MVVARGQIRAAWRHLHKQSWEHYAAAAERPPSRLFLPLDLVQHFGASSISDLRRMYLHIQTERILAAIIAFGKKPEAEPKILAAACAPFTKMELARMSDWLLECAEAKAL